MKTPQELQLEAEFQYGCSLMWDEISRLPDLSYYGVGDAANRAQAHRELAIALERQIRIRRILYWAYIIALLVVGVSAYTAVT